MPTEPTKLLEDARELSAALFSWVPDLVDQAALDVEDAAQCLRDLAALIAEIIRERDDKVNTMLAEMDALEDRIMDGYEKLARLTAERDALREDAARWQWVKGQLAGQKWRDIEGVVPQPDALEDEKYTTKQSVTIAVDAARTQEPTP